MQGDALKLRLSSLKKASIELKFKVLNQPKINYDTINDIIASIVPSQVPDSPSILPLSQADTLKSRSLYNSAHPKLSTSQVHSPTSSLFLVPPSPMPNNSAPAQTQPLKVQQEKVNWHERSSSNDSLYSKDPIDSQIDLLRIQNQEIEMQLTSLSEEVRNLHKKQASMDDESWKENLPFLNQDGNAGIFITKLFIKEYDYDKIDYEDGKLQISYDKLLINLPIKPTKQYKLSTLVQVKYIGTNNLKIDFKIEQTIFIFIHFQDHHQRDQYDLALFTNHKIVTHKDLDRSLFIDLKQKQQLWTPQFSKTSKSSLRHLQELDQRNIEYRLGDKTDRLRKNSSRVSDQRLKKSNFSNRSIGSSVKREDSFRNLNGIQYTLSGNDFDNNNEMPSTPQYGSDLQERSFNDIVVFDSIGDSNRGSRTNTSKFNAQEINFNNMELESPEEHLGMPLVSPEKIQEQRELLNWNNTIHELKEGYIFTKYAKDGTRPHNKKLFITSQEAALVIMNTIDSQDKKVIPISQILSVKHPAIGDGIRKFLGTVVSDSFCVIQYTLQGRQKAMELGCYSPKFMTRFIEQLRQFLAKKNIFH